MNKKINIFPFTTNFFKDVPFEKYFRDILPDVNILEHSCVRTPNVIVFAYEGDHNLWGYAEIGGWRYPTLEEAETGIDWGGSKFRRIYMIKPYSLREFVRHVPYEILRRLGFNTRSIIYCPKLTEENFSQVLKESGGEIELVKAS